MKRKIGCDLENKQQLLNYSLNRFLVDVLAFIFAEIYFILLFFFLL